MNNKNLISQLNNLKSVSPEKSWLESNREILLGQISNSGATELSAFSIFVINIKSLARTASQPALALAVFVFVLVSGSVFSHQFLNQAKPNGSLYIARIISEKAKLTTVFNQEEKDRLAFQFASEHVRDIIVALSNSELDDSENEDQVAKLNDNFKKEIVIMKSSANRLAVKDQIEELAPEEEMIVSIAGEMKNDEAIQIYQRPSLVVEEEVVEEEDVEEEVEVSGTDKILEELEQSMEDQDHDSALNKLEEVKDSVK